MSDDLLQESVEELYEHGPCGYLFTRMDGTILRANDTLLSWIGYARDDLVGKRRFQDLLTIPGKIFYENQYFPLLRMQGTVKEVAFELSRQDGERLPVLINSIMRTDAEGKPKLIASAIFDATDRRAYEQELMRSQRSAEELAAVVRMSSDAIVSLSPTGIIETWNDGAARLFGYSAHHIVGTNLRRLLPESLKDESWDQIMGELRAGRPVQQDMVARRVDGVAADVSAGFTPHWGLLGELDAVSVIMRDIAQRRAVERLQQEFLAMATHELRSPVTGIKGNAQLMRRRGVYSERSVDVIIGQAEKLQRLIDDLLLASQLQADRFTVRLAEVDLVAAARTAVAYLGAAESAIKIEAAEEPLIVAADQHRLNQVLTNLLTNALKYSPDGADVTVRIAREANEARIAVVDRGAGIPPEAIPHLFERFYRVTGTAHMVQGLGLGLYISNRIVEAHGGRIEVESEPGRGSTFSVVLPMGMPPGG
jgi:PAS domain S-box-containing protein